MARRAGVIGIEGTLVRLEGVEPATSIRSGPMCQTPTEI
jgi:hypothetical protein